MVTVGAAPALGTAVSIVTGTLVLVVLPAGSVAVTGKLAAPSGSGCVGVTLQVPSGLTVVVSTSPVGLVTVMVLPGSPVPLMVGVLSLVMPSPLVPLSLAGSSWAVSAGAVVSMMALSLPVAPVTPAGSRTCAVTVSVWPSPGLAMPGSATLPWLMSAAVSTIGACATPLTLVSSVSPALAVAGSVTLTSMLPCRSAALM